MSDNLTPFEGRLFHKFMFPEGVFRLIKWDSSRKEGALIRLCDNYKVPLDQHNFRSEIYSLPEIQGAFYMMSHEEEKSYEKSYLTNKIHIKYKVDIDLYTAGSMSNTYCEPVSVLPPDIPIQEVFLFM